MTSSFGVAQFSEPSHLGKILIWIIFFGDMPDEWWWMHLCVSQNGNTTARLFRDWENELFRPRSDWGFQVWEQMNTYMSNSCLKWFYFDWMKGERNMVENQEQQPQWLVLWTGVLMNSNGNFVQTRWRCGLMKWISREEINSKRQTWSNEHERKKEKRRS